MRITNNLYVLSGSYFSAVNDVSTLGDVYGIRTAQGVIVIDCGSAITGPAMLRETLAYFDVSEPITYAVITHAHYDHCGGAKELQDAGAKLIVGDEDAAYCKNGGVWGLYSPYDVEQSFPSFTPDITVTGEQTMEINDLLFEFIKIPGHTPGSIAIKVEIDGKTVMFTGDALQPDGILLENATFGWQGDPGFSRKSIVDSMMNLMKHETDMILPGHGKICLRNGTKVLRHAAQTAFNTFR